MKSLYNIPPHSHLAPWLLCIAGSGGRLQRVPQAVQRLRRPAGRQLRRAAAAVQPRAGRRRDDQPAGAGGAGRQPAPNGGGGRASGASVIASMLVFHQLASVMTLCVNWKAMDCSVYTHYIFTRFECPNSIAVPPDFADPRRRVDGGHRQQPSGDVERGGLIADSAHPAATDAALAAAAATARCCRRRYVCALALSECPARDSRCCCCGPCSADSGHPESVAAIIFCPMWRRLYSAVRSLCMSASTQQLSQQDVVSKPNARASPSCSAAAAAACDAVTVGEPASDGICHRPAIGRCSGAAGSRLAAASSSVPEVRCVPLFGWLLAIVFFVVSLLFECSAFAAVRCGSWAEHGWQ